VSFSRGEISIVGDQGYASRKKISGRNPRRTARKFWASGKNNSAQAQAQQDGEAKRVEQLAEQRMKRTIDKGSGWSGLLEPPRPAREMVQMGLATSNSRVPNRLKDGFGSGMGL